MEAFIAKVTDQHIKDDSLSVVFLGLSGVEIEYKVKVLHSRANGLRGIAGNLPEIGETGVVIKLPAYGEEYFWVGSYHNPVENLCTEEAKTVVNQHDSDVWSKIDKDGNIEFSHPSGTYLKIGSDNVLSERTKHIKVSGTYNIREEEVYQICAKPVVDLFLKHVWALGQLTQDNCSYDKNKSNWTGEKKQTTIKISSDGVLTINHDNSTGAPVSLVIGNDGAILLTTPKTITVQAEDDITIQSDGHITVQAEDGIDQDGGLGNLTGAVTQECVCPLVGSFHIDYSANVKATKG